MTTNADGEQVPQPASPEQLANIVGYYKVVLALTEAEDD